MILPTIELQKVYSEYFCRKIDNKNIKIDLFGEVNAYYSDNLRFISIKFSNDEGEIINHIISFKCLSIPLIQRAAIKLYDEMLALFKELNNLSTTVSGDRFIEICEEISDNIKQFDMMTLTDFVQSKIEQPENIA